MNAVASPVTLHRPLAAEEAARADFYALLSRLLQAAPDGALLASLAQAGPMEGGAPRLEKAWRDLVNASSAMDEDAALDEHDALFGGMGKAAVSLYAGFYAGAAAVDHPRVRIRADLAGLGLVPHTMEPEDFIPGLFDAMRVLVAGGAGRGPATVDEQRRFFDAHLSLAWPKLVDAMSRHEKANYYRRVAELAAAFLAIESESFELD
jgi:TorA maturation chaperone TorD